MPTFDVSSFVLFDLAFSKLISEFSFLYCATIRFIAICEILKRPLNFKNLGTVGLNGLMFFYLVCSFNFSLRINIC
jgi:hypothetical protein